MWKHSIQCCIFSIFFQFDSLHIYSTKCFFFKFKNALKSIASGVHPRPRWGAFGAPITLDCCIKLGSRKGSTRSFGANIQLNPISKSWRLELWFIFWPSSNYGFLIKCDSSHAEIFFLRNWEKYQIKSWVAGARYAQSLLGKLQYSWGRIFLAPKSGLRPSTSNSKIRHLEITDFRFKYTPECTVSSMNFKKNSGEGLTEPPPQTPPPA